MKPQSPLKLLTIWLNAISAAWNMGEADWLYADGRNIAVALFCHVLNATGDLGSAVHAVVAEAHFRKIDPKRHKWHGRA